MAAPRPSVVFWYRVYCGFMAALYALVMLGGVAWVVFGAGIAGSEKDEMPQAVLLAYAAFLVVLGLSLTAAFGAPFFLAPRPWVWIYGIVLIAIGLTSCCLWPATIPMLVYWLKPETRAYFGRP